MPMVLMGYYNPFLAYGLEDRLADDAASVRASTASSCRTCRWRSTTPFLDACLAARVGPRAAAGAHQHRRPHRRGVRVRPRLHLLRQPAGRDRRPQPDPAGGRVPHQPRSQSYRQTLAVGFGISRKAQVDALPDSVDAVVVGSALVDLIASSAPDELESKVHEFLTGLGASPRQQGENR